MPTINSYLSLLHGIIVASGLILYSLGAKYLPSAELALLSLMEVVGMDPLQKTITKTVGH